MRSPIAVFVLALTLAGCTTASDGGGERSEFHRRQPFLGPGFDTPSHGLVPGQIPR
ncbi:hypothetical protein [Aurantimonas sp. VKM B-3413]|uniref:hypothetical protein n=1 Tax=Aurantimonas sp. VKM B-3413 TaxID=2779401 RepID=UPI001E63221D|nr:hypothetical protein [Aurantimonas sp. VKM B-3413]MCB8837532.1 hypothetical protein [Aurantimonas sp. VKM B-3413]